MTQIISSTFQANIQVDGRSTVHEIHVDDSGNQYAIDYMAEKGSDLNTHLAQSAAAFNAQFIIAAAALPSVLAQQKLDAQNQIITLTAIVSTLTAEIAAIPVHAMQDMVTG